jgi:hypothetical protein
LAGQWNTWTDKASGEIIESYTMLTINADHHPLMSRMHKPDPKLPPDRGSRRNDVTNKTGAEAPLCSSAVCRVRLTCDA